MIPDDISTPGSEAAERTAPAGPRPSGATTDSDRLNGWKDIASYIGKGVRTAQRWERQFGMPVHRIGGEVVFALRSEIDEWSTAESGERLQNGALNLPADVDADSAMPPSGRLVRLVQRHPRRSLLVIALAGILTTLGVWAGTELLRWSRSTAPIADVRLAGNHLEALDADAHVLWSYPFSEAQPPLPASDPSRPTRLIIRDLTGDGRPEVVYSAMDTQTGHRLVVFDSDGSVRFQHQWTGTVRFGSVDYHGPFQAMRVWVTESSAGVPQIWLSSRDRVEFPSVLERLDVFGHDTGEYWSGGEIAAMVAGTVGGRDVVMVGSVVNEGYGAGLAVFDANSFGGTAPNPDEKHSCTSCPPGRPVRFYLFPRDELSRAVEGESSIGAITLRSGAFTVDVWHAAVPDPVYGTAGAVANYTFDSASNLERAEYGYQYRIVHDRLHALGLVDHAFAGHRDGLLPIREWRDGKFVDVWPKDRDQGPETRNPGTARQAR